MFIISLLVIVSITYAAEPCETPNGQQGDCKPINQCALIYSYFQRGTISLATNKYLRKSICGFVGTYPKVCCPLGSSIPPKTKLAANFIITSELLPNSSVCGLSTESKIFGGNRTALDEYPWMALLEYKSRNGNNYFACGGALLNRRYVLTARHCLSSTLFRVRLGEYNTETDPDIVRNGLYEDRAPAVVKIEVEDKILHSDPASDIGLIRLRNEVDYSDFIKPICLPLTTNQLSKPHVGQKLMVAGWGLTEKRARSKIKLKVQIPVKPLSDCDLFGVPLSEKFICAGGEKGKDSCTGDSGGPLMGIILDEDRNPHWYTYGIVSFGPNNPCGQEGKPAVHVKVVKFVKWIVANLEP